MEVVVARKLRPVIEGDGLAPRGGQGRQQGVHGLGDGGGGLPGGRAAMSRREWRSWRVKMAWP